MIKFIFKIFKFIFTLLVAGFIFIYVFSIKNNMSFGNTVSYFKTISAEFLNIDYLDDVSENEDNIIILTSSNNNYYYSQLDDNAKIIYSTLENNIDSLTKENYIISFSTRFNNLLNTSTGKYKLNRAFQSALDAFFYDHPEIFYIDMSKISLNTTCVSIGNIKTYTVDIRPKDNNYLHDSFNSEQEVKMAIKQVENVRNNIVSATDDKNIYNKIKYVHDKLVNNIKYDSTCKRSNTHNIYGALIEKQVVCEGYAKAFKYIMDNLNIECILVAGTSTNSSGKSEAHMWNYVKLNDEWYGVDVTWDDPIINGGIIKNNLRHDYFLKGRHTFVTSHSSSGKISETGMLFNVPNLSGTNYKK